MDPNATHEEWLREQFIRTRWLAIHRWVQFWLQVWALVWFVYIATVIGVLVVHPPFAQAIFTGTGVFVVVMTLVGQGGIRYFSYDQYRKRFLRHLATLHHENEANRALSSRAPDL